MAERLSTLDAAFLHIEHPATPMHVAGLYLFEGMRNDGGRPDLVDLQRLVEERLPLVPRYRQRVLWVPLGLSDPEWVDDPAFDISYHVRRAAVPRPGGMAELLELVARIHERPLDRARPLWEMYAIEGLADSRIAIFTKVHHAMVDGIAGTDLAQMLYDDSPEGRHLPRPRRFMPPALPSRAHRVAESVREASANGALGLLTMAVHPLRTSRRATVALARDLELRHLLPVLRPAPEGPLNGPVGPHRRIALTTMRLDRIRTIRGALGGTVNDVVLAVVGEGIQHFLHHRAVPHDDLRYRVMVPVSTRDASHRGEMGNDVASMFVEIPVSPMPADRRLHEVSRAMLVLKEHHQAYASERLLEMASWTPPTLHPLALRPQALFQRVFNLVVSNVPGPQRPLYAQGLRLLETYPLLPLAMRLGVNVCVSSYCGVLYFGVVADRDLLPDLGVLIEGMNRGMERLDRAAARHHAPAVSAKTPTATATATATATDGARRHAAAARRGAAPAPR